MDNNFNNGGFDPNQNQFNNFGQQAQDQGQQFANQAQQFGQQVQDQGQQFANQAQNFGQQVQDQGMNQQFANQAQNFGQQAQDQGQQFTNQAQNFGQQAQDQAQNFGGGMQMAGQDMSQQFAQINQQNQQQFGQQAQNFGGPNPGMQGGMPVNPTPNNTKPAKVKKPMSKGAIIGIISGAVALVALIVCGIIFLPKIFDPKKKIEDAFEKTFNSENSVDLAKDISEKGGETSFTIAIDSVSGMDIDSSVDFDLISNNAAKQLSGKMVLNIKGDELVKANIFADENNTYIELEDAINGYLSFPNKGFGDAFINSPLMADVDADDLSALAGLDLDYFGGVEAVEEGEDMFDELWDKAEIKKKGKQSITVNGKSVKAKQYEITFAKDDVLDMVDDILAKATADYDLSELGVDSSTLRSAVSTVIGGDIVANVYIADKEVVRVDCNSSSGMINYNVWLDYDDTAMAGAIELSAMGETISLKLDVKDPNGNPSGSVTADLAGEQVVFNFTSTTSSSSDETKADIKFDVSYEGEELIAGSVSMDMNTKNTTPATRDTSLKVYDLTTMTEDDAVAMAEENQDQLAEWAGRFMQNELIGSLMADYGTDVIDYDDLDDYDDFDDYDGDDDYDDDDDYDTTLETSGQEVEILGSIMDTELSYGCDYFIDYDGDSIYIEYELEDNSWYTIDELMSKEGMYVPESDDYYDIEMYEESYGNVADFEDTQIYWSMASYAQSYVDYDWEPDQIKKYRFLREVTPGFYLYTDITLYGDSPYYNATTEELMQAISSQYFSVK